MSYLPMYEFWKTTIDDATFEMTLDLGHMEDYPLTSHPWFFGIRIPMANKSANGLPTEEETFRLNTVENRIRAVCKQRDGLYVGQRQGQGNRDLLIYFPRRPSGLDERIRASIGTELLFISRNDRQWQGYEQLLPQPENWRFIEDHQQISELLDMGANPLAIHAIEHQVSTPLKKGADALIKLFELLELEDIKVEGDKPHYTVSGIQHTTLDAEHIVQVSFVLDSRAPKAHGDYLGWTTDPIESAEPLDIEGALTEEEDDDWAFPFDEDDA